MESLFDTVSRKSDSRPWTRQDSINEIRAKRERENLFNRFRGKIQPCFKFAVVKREGKFFSIVGHGIQRVKTFAGLKQRAKKLGFTHVRFGAIKQELK